TGASAAGRALGRAGFAGSRGLREAIAGLASTYLAARLVGSPTFRHGAISDSLPMAIASGRRPGVSTVAPNVVTSRWLPVSNFPSASVNVEHVMEQIRARISEKRGVDYTDQQIRELAAVKLERFLDPRGVRSDLLDQFRKTQPAYEPPELPNFAFEDET